MAVVTRLLAVLLLLAAVVGLSWSAAVHTRRSVKDSNSPSSDRGMKICHNSTPCEWAVYIPFTRRVDYIMKNTCECARGQICVRTGDDLSASAYVHRCRTPELQAQQPT